MPLTSAYSSWKANGPYSYPAGITSGRVRPLTNKDYTNNVVYKHGSTRPQKWAHRIGTQTRIPSHTYKVDPNNPNSYVIVPTIDQPRIAKSNASLALVSQLNDFPGRYSVKHNNTLDEKSEILQADKACNDCTGVAMVADFKPSPFLTNNPQPVCVSPNFCCNEQKKALLRVRPASTNLKKNYFTTLQQYRENRCQTYDQRIFNFQTPISEAAAYAIQQNNPYVTPGMIKNAKPGSALATENTYNANCYPNTGNTFTNEQIIMIGFNMINKAGLFTEQDILAFYASNIQTSIADFIQFLSTIQSGNGQEAIALFDGFLTNPYLNNTYLTGPSNSMNCKRVVYKPSNPQFAVQGGVSSSARTLKLGLTTIEKAVYEQNKQLDYIYSGGNPQAPFIYKSKVPACNPGIPLIFSQITKNPKTCFKNNNDYMDPTLHNLTAAIGGPNVATNGISATMPGGQPLGISN
jgi:hypothetical protein